MRMVPGLLVLSVAVSPAVLLASQAPPSAVPTKAEMQKIVDANVALRNAGRWEQYAERYTADATLLSSAGRREQGRAELMAGLKDNFASGVYKGALTKVTVDAVQAIAPNVILVDQTWELSNLPGGGVRKGHGAVVFVKSGDTWKVAAERNMVPVAAGAVKPAP